MTYATAGANSPAAPVLVPICGERTSLPDHLVPIALEHVISGTAQTTDVQRHLRCTLQQHTTSDHHAFVLHLDGTDTGSVWTRWVRGHPPVTVSVLPECDAAGLPPHRDACCEFAGHTGAHTYGIADPFLIHESPLATTRKDTRDEPREEAEVVESL